MVSLARHSHKSSGARHNQRVDDLELARALAAGDAEALEKAERELVPVARRAIAKVDASNAFVDEILQLVRTRLFVADGDRPALISTFRGSGPLAGWIRVVATRAAIDAKRAVRRDHDDDALDRLPAPDDPELALVWRTCADAYRAALGDAFAALSRRDRNLMRQRYLDQLELKALARMYQVDASTVSRWLSAIESKLAADTRAAVVAALRLTDSQLESMERLVASQLQLSLPRILRART